MKSILFLILISSQPLLILASKQKIPNFRRLASKNPAFSSIMICFILGFLAGMSLFIWQIIVTGNIKTTPKLRRTLSLITRASKGRKPGELLERLADNRGLITGAASGIRKGEANRKNQAKKMRGLRRSIRMILGKKVNSRKLKTFYEAGKFRMFAAFGIGFLLAVLVSATWLGVKNQELNSDKPRSLLQKTFVKYAKIRYRRDPARYLGLDLKPKHVAEYPPDFLAFILDNPVISKDKALKKEVQHGLRTARLLEKVKLDSPEDFALDFMRKMKKKFDFKKKPDQFKVALFGIEYWKNLSKSEKRKISTYAGPILQKVAKNVENLVELQKL